MESHLGVEEARGLRAGGVEDKRVCGGGGGGVKIMEWSRHLPDGHLLYGSVNLMAPFNPPRLMLGVLS